MVPSYTAVDGGNGKLYSTDEQINKIIVYVLEKNLLQN
jgi:hypothetical protein